MKKFEYMNIGEKFYSQNNKKNIEGEILLYNNKLSKFCEFKNIKGLLKRSSISMAYSGHQYGHFVNLGDGRAALIDEVLIKNRLYDIHAKGIGKTKYSRSGDGKAPLNACIREYIISEMLYKLNIETTRSLAVIDTKEKIVRREIEDAGIIIRIAKNHIRFGTFEYAASTDNVKYLKNLIDYSIKREYGNLDKISYLDFFIFVSKKNIELVNNWIRVGFVHGVMNTDNMLISGETIDLGPCAFIDIYDKDKKFSSIDRFGRYSFLNQKKMVIWNIVRFASTFVPLINKDKNKSVDILNEEIEKLVLYSDSLYQKMISNKIGLDIKGKNCSVKLLEIMQSEKMDYTNTFIYLRELILNTGRHINVIEEKHKENILFKDWINNWKQNNIDIKLMEKNNPFIIPRNHIIESLIKSRDYNKINKFLNIYKAYNYDSAISEYNKRDIGVTSYRTFCGT